MSRSRRGGKPPGYEYWSKRPGKGSKMPSGKSAKKSTHKAERRQAKKEIRSK